MSNRIDIKKIMADAEKAKSLEGPHYGNYEKLEAYTMALNDHNKNCDPDTIITLCKVVEAALIEPEDERPMWLNDALKPFTQEDGSE